uniref:Uncharacterized protein n=1 Tax=viral metagenome TaxID=1070528 RepID=A0A6C0C8I3_9ZZZZ
MQYDQTLLCTILNENDIEINETQMVSLNDITQKIIKAKKPKTFIADIADKILIHNKYYITLDACHELLHDLQLNDGCNRITTKHNFSNIIDFEKNILQFNEYLFTAFLMIEGSNCFGVWIRYNEILDLLNLNDDMDIENENIMTYETLSKCDKFPKINNGCKYKYSRFINLAAISFLIDKSMAIDIDEIKKFFNEDIAQSFDTYIKRVIDQFFYCKDILGIDIARE